MKHVRVITFFLIAFTVNSSLSWGEADAMNSGLSSDHKVPATVDEGLVAADASKAPAETALVEPGWLGSGWNLFNQKKKAEAIKIWQQGLDRLPGQEQVLFAGVYIYQSAALRQLQKLGRENSALLVYAPYRDSQAWYVLSLPNRGVEQMKKRLSPFIKGKVYSSHVTRFQSGGRLQASTSMPVKKTSRKIMGGLSVSKLFMRAQKAVNRNNISAAMDLLAQIVGQAPEHHRARLLYGELLVRSGKYKESSMVLHMLLKEENRDWHAWYWAATASLLLNNLGEANAFISKALSIHGDSALLWIEKAVIEQERQDYQQAINYLNVAKKYAGDLPSIYLNMAYCADKLGNKKLADQSYTRFLVLTVNNDKYASTRRKVLSEL